MINPTIVVVDGPRSYQRGALGAVGAVDAIRFRRDIVIASPPPAQ
jgi:hypothetical protein